MNDSRLIIKGITWSSIAQAGRQLTQIGTFIILANLIAPRDFGLVNTVTIVIGFINVFNDLGTSAALIQKREISPTLISSVFWLNLLFSLVVLLVVFWLAPLIAWFYDDEAITALLRVLSITFLITALGFAHKALLERNMAFNQVAKIELGSMVIGAAAGISAALLDAGAWSLILQTVVTSLGSSAGLWFSSDWRPQWVFDRTEIKTIFSFSRGLTGFSILNYFARNADNILIGKYLGLTALGYYSIAYRIMLFPLENVSRVIGRVMFPVFSRMQDDNQAFSRLYLKVIGVIALVTFPLMLGLAVVSSSFVHTLLGEKWQPVVVLIWILAPVGMSQSIYTTVGYVYMAKGRADQLFWWGTFASLFFIASFVIGLSGGVVGVALAYATAYVLLTYPAFAIPFRLIDLRISQLVDVLYLPTLTSLAMFFALAILQAQLPSRVSSAGVLLICVPTGVAVYLGASYLFNRRQLREIADLVRFKQAG